MTSQIQRVVLEIMVPVKYRDSLATLIVTAESFSDEVYLAVEWSNNICYTYTRGD